MKNLSKHAFRHRHDACDERVMRARLLFARELLVRYGVPYNKVWRYAGFISAREMERHWDRLF